MPTRVVALVPHPCIGDSGDGDTRDRGAQFVETDAPILQALDLGVTRGDGVFESISVGHGKLQALEAHLARFERSAGMLDLPAPGLDSWRAAIHAAADALDPVVEAFVKTVLTRGVEGGTSSTGPAPTGYVIAEHSPDFTDARERGIRVVLLDRGYASDVAATSPWLLQGAKTLSYAVNRAAMREAKRRDADDVIFVSTDGVVLEGPTANVVVRVGDRLLTPPTDLGILAGTTQADLFRLAPSVGLTASYAALTPDALRAADAIWLVSSVRHAAPIRSIDGVARPIDAALTTEFNEFLVHRTE